MRNAFMKIFASAGVLALALCAFATPARAQSDEALLGRRHLDYSSPQHFYVELRFGPYLPGVDSAFSATGPTPYADHFGNAFDPKRGNGTQLLAGLEVDWQILRIPHLGTIGPGLGVSYTQANGISFETANPGVQAGTSTLQIIPMYGVAVLRADVFMREAHIPLVPYAKAGIGVAYWRSSNDSGTSSVPVNTGTAGTTGAPLRSGEGATWGTQFGLGVALQLNIFDQQAAKNFDTNYGVNNSYAYVELVRIGLDGFGNGTSMILANTTFCAGLAVEF